MSFSDLQKEVQLVSSANARFSSNLHKVLEKSKAGENLIFSPFSLSTVLAMLKLGAKGNSAVQLDKALFFPGDSDLQIGYNLAIDALKEKSDESEYKLSTANKIYSMKGFALKDLYSSSLTKFFKTGMEELDFANAVESARTINKFVEEETNEKIKNLLAPDALGPDTRVVLVNAIYFKGFWKNKFSEKDTVPGEFLLNDKGDKVQVPLMKLRGKKFCVGHLENFDNLYEVISLPYKGERLSMMIFLPKEFTTYENDAGFFKHMENPLKIMERLEECEVDLTMPKFKAEITLQLVEELKKLGLEDIFDSQKADFSGICDQPLYVSEVVQKCFIEVNEEGAEAAAATAAVMMLRCMPFRVTFEVNRPFYYQIVDFKSNFVLFQGKCINPQ